MKTEVRAAAAAIAISKANGKNISSIYDYSGSGHRSMNVSINGDSVTAYDYVAGCHISGSLPGLYHYGVGGHLTLNWNGGGNFDGYDYDAGCHFAISVNGNSAQVYDYGEGGYFNYSG